MAEKVAVLVNRAALDWQNLTPQRGQRGFQARGTVNDDEFGPFQAAPVEVVEELAPG